VILLAVQGLEDKEIDEQLDLPLSAVRRFCGGWVRMPSNPGFTKVGFFLVLQTLPKRLVLFLIFIKPFGTTSQNKSGSQFAKTQNIK
jgi:hypothetical protein